MQPPQFVANRAGAKALGSSPEQNPVASATQTAAMQEAIGQSAVLQSAAVQSAIAERSATLFSAQQQDIYRRTDRIFAILMVLQWLGGIVAALLLSPLTWSGQFSSTHIHVYAAIFLGGAIISFPVFLALSRPGTLLTRHVIAVAQMLMSALLIHLTGGRLETHFHIFGSLAFLAFYRDPGVLISASVVVGLDHFLRGMFWPQSVFGVATSSNWRWIEHAAWVAFEDIFLWISIAQSRKEMQDIADRRAELEATNQQIERAVQERTAELHESEELFRSLSAASPIGVFRTDRSGCCTYVNQCCVEITGLSEDVLLRDGWLEAIYAEDRAELLELMRQKLNQDADFSHEFRLQTPGGEVRWVQVHSTPVWADDGHCTGRVGTVEDISPRKRTEDQLRQGHIELERRVEERTRELEHANHILEYAREEAEKANRAKSEFLSRMSHELRTPLNAILGFGQLLETDELSDEQAESVMHITKAGRHLLGLINEVLDISRIESGRLVLSMEPLSVRDIAEEALNLLQPLAQSRQIVLHNDLVDDCDIYVQADHQRLRQVFINLLGNAIKYNRDAGEVFIRCTAAAPETVPRMTRIEVRDTGYGIAPHKMPRLFQPFERLGAENSNIEGSGIGLALCKRLLELMHGTIGVQSDMEQGSTFWFELPVAENTSQPLELEQQQAPSRVHQDSVHQDDIQQNSAPVPSTEEKAKPHRILYIEDNMSNFLLVQGIFKIHREFELLGASDGLSGFGMAQEINPDLILLDLNLPDLSGEQVMQLLRRSAVRDTPVIIISASATPDQARQLTEAGAHAYVTKPFEVQDFLRVVDKALADGAGKETLH